MSGLLKPKNTILGGDIVSRPPQFRGPNGHASAPILSVAGTLTLSKWI